MTSKVKPRLSKGILEMKFMKKTKAKVDKEAEDEEGKMMYQNEITNKMLANSNFIIEPSFVNIEGLLEGRFSCRGMNPEIEKILENERLQKEEATRPKMESDVTDKEKVHFYSKSSSTSLSRNVSKKFEVKKRKSNSGDYQKGSKFLKPKDSDED